MRNLFKKLAYIVLTLAITNASLQAVYATSINCDEAEMAEHADDNHCMSQKTKDVCECDNCSCDMCITLQANIQTALQTFSYLVITDITSTTISHQYTQHYHNPLLRPPIA